MAPLTAIKLVRLDSTKIQQVSIVFSVRPLASPVLQIPQTASLAVFHNLAQISIYTIVNVS
jgi:hypothetical protein